MFYINLNELANYRTGPSPSMTRYFGHATCEPRAEETVVISSLTGIGGGV